MTGQNDRQSKPSTQQGKQKTMGKASPLGVRHPKAHPAKQKGPKRAD